MNNLVEFQVEVKSILDVIGSLLESTFALFCVLESYKNISLYNVTTILATYYYYYLLSIPNFILSNSMYV